MARALGLFFVILMFTLISLAGTQNSMMPQSQELAQEILDIVSGHSEQVRQGAQVYDLVCSNCHGNTGLGFEEGKREFAPEHQKCEKCHRPFNAARLVDVEISDKNSFDLGNPPALHGETMQKFVTAAGVYSYIKAAMPRYAPGNLTDQEYLNITAFLLAMNTSLPKGTTITNESLQEILLTP